MEVITGIITLQVIFIKYWQSFKNWYKGKIREAVLSNVEKILKCRTGQLGFHAYRCPKCGEVKLVPHSCKSRFCSSCGKITRTIKPKNPWPNTSQDVLFLLRK